MAYILEVKNLRKIYKDGKKTVEALKGISFNIEKGKITGLLGPNGAGKTTTIKCILGLVIPTEGEIYLDGIDIQKNLRKAYTRISAVLEGNRNIHWRLTVYENLRFFAGLQGISEKKAKDTIHELIKTFGLEEKMDTQARFLSRGMQQKLAVACAFVKNTDVILLDEPTLGLDVEASHELRWLIKKKAKEEGKTILLSSHDMGVVEDICDRVIIINQGRIVADDTVENLKAIFRVTAFRFEIADRLSPEIKKEITEKFSHVKITENPSETSIDVEFPEFTDFYRFIDVLKLHSVRIKNIVSKEPDFEDIYLKIVRGKNVDTC